MHVKSFFLRAHKTDVQPTRIMLFLLLSLLSFASVAMSNPTHRSSLLRARSPLVIIS